MATLASRCAILRRELGLSGMTVAETVHEAATQLGVDGSGKSLVDIAALCMEALGVGQDPAGTSSVGQDPAGTSSDDITLRVDANARPASLGRMARC